RAAFRRSQGADRRLLDVQGEVEGRGDRVGRALSHGIRRRDRDPPAVRGRRLRRRAQGSRAAHARSDRKEQGMSKVRVLVGTRKGAFILTADGKRERWDVSGPHFGGWEMYHLKGSPVDPNRIYASQSSSWFGQIIQR